MLSLSHPPSPSNSRVVRWVPHFPRPRLFPCALPPIGARSPLCGPNIAEVTTLNPPQPYTQHIVPVLVDKNERANSTHFLSFQFGGGVGSLPFSELRLVLKRSTSTFCNHVRRCCPAGANPFRFVGLPSAPGCEKIVLRRAVRGIVSHALFFFFFLPFPYLRSDHQQCRVNFCFVL